MNRAMHVPRSGMLFLVCIVMLLLVTSDASAAYEPTQILVIDWGNEAGQLKVGAPYLEDVNFTPGDTTDDVIFQGGGPQGGFVDREENIYFFSYEFHYFKAFSSAGELIVNYSRSEIDFNSEFYKTSVTGFCVDSLGHIYFISFMPLDFVPVADRNNNLIARLTPFGIGSGVEATNIYFNSHDVITIRFDAGFYTYRNGTLYEGGSSGWLAPDSHYYFVGNDGKTTLKFMRIINPDLEGIPQHSETEYREYVGEMLYADLLAVDDELALYVYIIEGDGKSRRIQIYDLDYSLQDEILLDPLEFYYSWSIRPFVRNDGNVYEFRCLDDGLHVYRWTRQ